ncbi:MAG: aminotransferase class I/II-fold pyridoxal phosphate-dependent enzyme, partial [Tannerella sp.]|nr:aminotransferase class I/II-fold pyridoxal phosphate-dependent enzyme [Tannerella sp.]
GINRTYRSRRELAGRIMQAMGCRYGENQVGMFLWGRIPDAEESGERLADRMLYEAGVFVTPGFVFGRAGDRYVRLSLCCPGKILEEALKRINF